MKPSYTGQKAFLLGNGINRLGGSGISWWQLLYNICEDYHIDVDLNNELKPFPLTFEEMLYAKDGRNNFQQKLRNLKTTISTILTEDADKLIDNDVHKGFMQSGVKDILTTNYDYNLETSFDSNFIQNKALFSINNLESKHSLYRGYNVQDVKVRHIHGELKHNRKIEESENSYPEESIMIGFEHYSDYFARIQNIIKGESGKQKDEKKSLSVRIRDNKIGKLWTDFFFTHHLILVGFSLDFSENHLWWLLFQREEIKRTPRHEINVNNQITFCIPNFPPVSNNEYINIIDENGFQQLYKKRISIERNKGIADILKSLKIDIDAIPCNNYKEFYQKVIEKYSEK